MNRSVLTAILSLVATTAFAAEAPAAKADPAKGRAMVETVCAACHGLDGNSAASANPSLAGQHPEYIRAQLAAFKKGERKNPIMSAQAAALSDQDMLNLAAYFSEQKPKERAATDKTLLAAGKKVYQAGNSSTGVPACMACHGPNGAGMPAQYPRLGGQHAAYSATQLSEFKAGKNRNNLVMHDIAMRLTDEEMKAVSEYIAGLR